MGAGAPPASRLGSTELVAHLKDLESRFPGLQHVNMSLSMGTPRAVMLEQLRWLAKEVMPKFRRA